MTNHNNPQPEPIRIGNAADAATVLRNIIDVDPTGSMIVAFIDYTSQVKVAVRVDLITEREGIARAIGTLTAVARQVGPVAHVLAGHWVTTDVTQAYWSIEAVETLAEVLGAETFQVRVNEGIATAVDSGASSPLQAPENPPLTREAMHAAMAPSHAHDIDPDEGARIDALGDDQQRETVRVAFRQMCWHHYGSGAADREHVSVVAAAMASGPLRDHVAKFMAEDDSPGMAEAMTWLAQGLTEHAAPAYGLAALAYYLDGDGLRAGITAEHGRQIDPTANMPQLILKTLALAVPPQDIRRMIQSSL